MLPRTLIPRELALTILDHAIARFKSEGTYESHYVAGFLTAAWVRVAVEYPDYQLYSEFVYQEYYIRASRAL